MNGKHGAGEVRQSVFMYVEAYYRIRLHSALDYVALMCLTVDKSLNSVCQMG